MLNQKEAQLVSGLTDQGPSLPVFVHRAFTGLPAFIQAANQNNEDLRNSKEDSSNNSNLES